MAATPQTEALEEWLLNNSAYLHTSVHIFHDEEAGVHMRASDKIGPSTTIAATPHSLALSYLNALVDEEYPVFKQHRHRFKVEAIGFSYLMLQYINRQRSFWKPYLDTLPSPDAELTQPLFFEDTEDIAWLDDTDVWHTVTARKEVYEQHYSDGMAILQEAGMNAEQCTWRLFLWAITTFTSRSFSSRSLRPHSGKYWAAYKTSSGGARQAVLLDMSRTSAEDLHFPVLFPGLDAANHGHDAKVDWTFDPGRFSVALAKPDESDGIATGEEVFNNYGPKSNGELLIGYGFCIEDNPHDTVAMTLKAPPDQLQDHLRIVHPGYFSRNKSWNSQKATFQMKKPTAISQTSSGLAQRPQIFHHLPEPLLELLLYIFRHERGLDFEFQERPLQYLTDLDSAGRKYLPHIARMIVQSLAPKLAKLQSTTPDQPPKNKRQQQASIYRQSQLSILNSLISALKTYPRALIYHQPSSPSSTSPIPHGPTLLTLPSFTALLQTNNLLSPAFLAGIETNAGTSDLTTLRAAGWEEDTWVLLLTWLLLHPSELPSWLREAFGEYIPNLSTTGTGSAMIDAGVKQDDQQQQEQAADLLPLVRTAAAALPGSRWEDERWSAEAIAKLGGVVMRGDSFLVMALREDQDGEEPCLFVYFLFP